MILFFVSAFAAAFLVLGVPFGFTGTLAAALATALGLSALIAAGFGEQVIAAAHRARTPAAAGLERTFQAVLREAGYPENSVRLLLTPDPAVSVVLCKSLGRGGAILLSQGACAFLPDEPLRQLLKEAVISLRRRGWVYRSTQAVLAHGLHRLIPEVWNETFAHDRSVRTPKRDRRSTHALGAIWALFIFSCIRVIVGPKDGRKLSVNNRILPARVPWTWNAVTIPGSRALYLIP
ncbi:MAG: hypothetical protein AB7P04_01550 [Bacteriovoracia bacterium]